jgi:hypothetical protein
MVNVLSPELEPIQRSTTRRSAGVTGMLTGISLPATLQMLNAERRDCVVEVDSFDGHGELVMDKGEIVAAHTSSSTGTKAALEVLHWPDVTVRIEAARPTATRDILMPLHQLLIDSYRLDDEEDASGNERGGPGSLGLDGGTAIDSAFDAFIDRPATNYDYASVLTALHPLAGVLTAKLFDLDRGVVVERGQAEAPATTPFWEADELTRQQLSLLMSVTTQAGLRDGLLVYDACAHLFRPLTDDGMVIAYLTLDTSGGNLVAARNVMRSLRLEPRGGAT